MKYCCFSVSAINGISTKDSDNYCQKRTMADRCYIKRVRAKWLCFAFKLDFFQLICKGCFFFKSNLELALSFALRQIKLHELNYVVGECKCLKTWDLLSFFDMFLNLKLWNISKRITSLILLNTYTTPQHALTHIILFVLW